MDLDWTPPDLMRKRGRPRVSCASTIRNDVDLFGVTWEEATELRDQSDWRNCILPNVLLEHEEGLSK